MNPNNPPHVAVVGAGAFGGWTALELRRRGAEVTIVDAWGPGHVRASSGGETRVIRATYGTRTHCTTMALRALQLWREDEARTGRRFFRRTGVLWMLGGPEAERFGDASAAALRAHGAPIEQFGPADAARRYPQIAFEGISAVMLEPDAGYLLARRACEHVIEQLIDAGGSYRLGAAIAPVPLAASALTRLPLTDGGFIDADVFVFACGPWLRSLFPEVIGERIAATRQEVYYFGAPAGDADFTDRRLPAWIDFRDTQFYGIPGNAHRGFKLADDASGPPIDPTDDDRNASPAGLASARDFLAFRFPALARAPFIGSEVCQYESTPDADFIIDHHPGVENVWLVGGGSGHGFKMGPAVGELVASLVLGERDPDPRFALRRFVAKPEGGWQAKWA
jgi:glycine/D-amino acid oxidase-like deaminating enzyme